MAASSYKELLKSGGFQSFLWTQFLGAYNDNVYKILVSLLAVEIGARNGKGSEYLSLAGVVFIVPFLLFSGYSGHLADVFNKRRVLIATKSLEVISMGLAIPALVSQRLDLMMAVLFLLALQATLFSPAKYGILPEMLPDRDLSRANGLLEMSTFVAIVVGTSSGTFLFSAWKHEPWKLGATMLAIAVVGTLMSFKIGRVASPAVRAPFALNPFSEVLTGMKRLYGDRALWLTVIGMSYFWFLGALFQMDLILLGREVMKLNEMRVGLMVTALAVGIGAGSMAAGRLSGDKVELGLVPLGSLGMGACWPQAHFGGCMTKPESHPTRSSSTLGCSRWWRPCTRSLWYRIFWCDLSFGCSPTPCSASASWARKMFRFVDPRSWWPTTSHTWTVSSSAPVCSGSSASWFTGPTTRSMRSTGFSA